MIMNGECQFSCIFHKFVLKRGKSLYWENMTLWHCFCEGNQQNSLLQKTIILCSSSKIHHTSHLLSGIARIDKNVSKYNRSLSIPLLHLWSSMWVWQIGCHLPGVPLQCRSESVDKKEILKYSLDNLCPDTHGLKEQHRDKMLCTGDS